MNILDADELNNNLNHFTILDSRWKLGQKNYLDFEYNKGHIPGAIKMDIEIFSKPNSKFPHMIPDKKYFEALISKMGISIDERILIYDQEGFISSTRIWFLLKIFGFKKLFILNGGFKKWSEKKLPVQKKKNTSYFKKMQKFTLQEEFIVNKQFVNKIIHNNEFHIIDARPSERFLGKVSEPRINVRRGNIEGSINLPFNKIHNKDGLILENKELEALFRKNYIDINKKIVCLCGSGITACNIIFALNKLSCRNVFLYDGSWSEWGNI